jgi:excisionase family DNA binding protein
MHEPIAYSVNDAIRVTSIKRTRLYQLINDGTIETVKVGGRRLVKVDSIKRLVNAA